MNKTIFITGISGCGKTTFANKFTKLGYEVIHLDEITKYYTKNRPILNEKVKYFIDILYGDLNFHIDFSNDEYLIINSFIKYITQLEGKYVIEGIQLFMDYIDIDYIMDYDIIIIKASMMSCLFRRIHRGLSKKNKLSKKIYNLIRYDLSYPAIIDIIRLSRFKHQLKNRNKKLETI